MKKKSYSIILLLAAITFSAQAQQTQQTKKPVDPYRMTAGMLEIFDPEIQIIQPGATYLDQGTLVSGFRLQVSGFMLYSM
jgi:hypothetical protein